MVERVIRILHEGFGAAHQAAKATTAKLTRRFFWPGLKRDVRLYVACCPVCEEFLRSTRTPKAGLCPMNVGGRGDCLAMDIVGGGESLPLTARGAKYILTLVDCFTRYAFAIPLNDQSSEAVINAVIGNYITVHGTPRKILTDQGKCFESALFLSFCKFFRISKIRTSGYRPQSNGICERFNQTLKRSLCKLLSKPLQTSWDLYLNFVVFSYNTSIHSSTGFSPHYLTFGSEARLPADLIFGTPDLPSFDDIKELESFGSLSSLFQSFSILNSSFSIARENLGLVHQREKDRYDLGAVERVFHPGDVVRIRFKSRRPGPSKFNSGWSGAHEVLGTQGVLVTVKENSTGRVYKMHHDRLSNPVFQRKFNPKFPEDSIPQPEDSDSNPLENPKEPENDLEPVADPQLALQRSRYGRVLKPKRDSNFDYSAFFMNSFESSTVDYCFMFHSASPPAPSANPDSQPPAAVRGTALSRLRRELVQAGERVFYVETPAGPEWMVMLRGSGTIMVYNAELGTFYNEPTEILLDDLRDYTPWPRSRSFRALSADEVELPSNLTEFPGWTPGSDAHLRPRYGYSDGWLNRLRTSAAIAGRTMEPLTVTEALASMATTESSVPEDSRTTAEDSRTTAEDSRSTAEILRLPTSSEPVSVPQPSVLVSTSTSMGSTSEVAKLSSPLTTREPSVSFPTTTTSSVELASSPAPLTTERESGTKGLGELSTPTGMPSISETRETPAAPDPVVAPVTEPLESAAPGSPLAGHILDASLRTALLDFSRVEGGRTVVDTGRLLDRCRHLGYGLVGPTTAPLSFPDPSPMDQGGSGWDDGEDTLGDNRSRAPTGEEAAQSDSESTATTRALEEVKRYTGELRSPGFEAAMAHDTHRLSVSDPALTVHRPETQQPAPTPADLGLEVIVTESAPSSLQLTPGTKAAGDSRKGSSLHRSKKRARGSAQSSSSTAHRAPTTTVSSSSKSKPVAPATAPKTRTPAELQAVVKEAGGREIRLSAFVARQRLEDLARPVAPTVASRPMVFATDSESEAETAAAENPEASTKPKHPEESKLKPKHKPKSKGKSLAAAVRELEGSLSSSTTSTGESETSEDSEAPLKQSIEASTSKSSKKQAVKKTGSKPLTMAARKEIIRANESASRPRPDSELEDASWSELPHYISVFSRKRPARDKGEPLYLDIKSTMANCMQMETGFLSQDGFDEVFDRGSETLRKWNSYVRKFANESRIGETIAGLAKTAKWKLIAKWPRWLFRAYGPRFATPEERATANFVCSLQEGLMDSKRVEYKIKDGIGKSAKWLDDNKDHLLSPQDIWNRIRVELNISDELNLKIAVLIASRAP